MLEEKDLSQICNSDLVGRLDALCKQERGTTLEILEHLNEIERRRLFLDYGFRSLFDYAVSHLKYSEPAASRRTRSARCIRDFPKVRELLKSGEANLTTVSIFSSVLTKENEEEVLEKVRGKSRAEVEKVVTEYREAEVVRDRIRPRNTVCLKPSVSRKSENQGSLFSPTNKVGSYRRESEPEPVQRESQVLRFKVEFSAGEEFMSKLNKVQALRSSKCPRGESLEDVFSEVLDEYLDRHSPERRAERREKQKQKAVSEKPGPTEKQATEKRSRHIPRAVRDEVFRRDRGRCSYVSADGVRCNSSWRLQVDHIVPYSLGGSHELGNLRLRCSRHNLLEAEKKLGPQVMDRFWKKDVMHHKLHSTVGSVA